MAKFSRFFIGLVAVVFTATAAFSFAAKASSNLPSVEVNLDVLENLRREALGLPPEPVKEPKKPAPKQKPAPKKQEVKKAPKKVEPKAEIVKQEPKIEEPKTVEEIVLPKEVEEPKKEEKSAEGSPGIKDLMTEGSVPTQKLPEVPAESSLKPVATPKGTEAVKPGEDPLAYLTKPNITDTAKEVVTGGTGGTPALEQLAPVATPVVIGGAGGTNAAELPVINQVQVGGVAGNAGAGGAAIPSEIPAAAPSTETAVGGAPTPALPSVDAAPQIPEVAAPAPSVEPVPTPAEEKGFIAKIFDSIMNIIKSITDFIMGLLGSSDKTEVVPPPVSGAEKAPAADIAIPGVPALGEVKSAIEEKKEEVKTVVNETANSATAKIEGVGQKVESAVEGAKTEAAKVIEAPKTESGLPEVQKLGGTAAAAVETLKELDNKAPAAPAATTETAPAVEAKPEEKKLDPAATPSAEPKKDDNVLLKLEFLPGGTDLTQEMNEKLDVLSKQILETKNTRYTIISYASNGTEEGSARKNSLKRALEVRKYLVSKNVDAARINVQAMGDATTEPPFDRIEITPSIM